MSKLLFSNKGQNVSVKNGAVINPRFTKEGWDEYKKRLNLALSKYQSSRKTRTVANILNKNEFMHTIFLGDYIKRLSINFAKDNQLFAVFLNVEEFADNVVDIGASKLIIKMNETLDLINKEKTIVSDMQVHNINKLIKKYKDYEKKLIDSIDYTKSIDGIYFGYLRFLLKRIFVSEVNLKKDLLEQSANLFTQIFIHIYKKSLQTSPSENIVKQLKIIAIYFVLRYYAELSQNEIKAKLKKAFGESAIKFLDKAKKSDIKEFNDVVNILFYTKVLQINKSFFDTMIKKYYGEIGYDLMKTSLQDTLAFFASINHKNILFNAVSPNEKITFRIEELILNEKKKVVQNERKVSTLDFETDETV